MSASSTSSSPSSSQPQSNLLLNPNSHSYVCLSRKGDVLGRFTNIACAAATAVYHRGSVLTPEGRVVGLQDCHNIVEMRKVVSDYSGKGKDSSSRYFNKGAA